VDDDDVAQFKTAVAQVRQKSSSTKIQAVPMHGKNIKIKKARRKKRQVQIYPENEKTQANG